MRNSLWAHKPMSPNLARDLSMFTCDYRTWPLRIKGVRWLKSFYHHRFKRSSNWSEATLLFRSTKSLCHNDNACIGFDIFQNPLVSPFFCLERHYRPETMGQHHHVEFWAISTSLSTVLTSGRRTGSSLVSISLSYRCSWIGRIRGFHQPD